MTHLLVLAGYLVAISFGLFALSLLELLTGLTPAPATAWQAWSTQLLVYALALTFLALVVAVGRH